jgi:tRNA nucleotidyltransferase (CCA-adding enzyme)
VQDIFDIIEKVAGDVTPSREERKKLEIAVRTVKERLDAAGIKYEIGGSYARDTWLSGDADVDFFMVYPSELGAEKINMRGLEDAERAMQGFPHWKRYAEHPYLEGRVKGVTVNLVPCADTEKGNWITSMDRSRFHTMILNQLLNDELKKQTRVLKSFLKANGIYGAEIRIGGFSGYVTEILTVKYGSFVGVLNGAKDWKRGTIISLSSDITINDFNTQIIIIDPVDNNRNLAAAIKPSNIAKLQLLAGRFLEKPSILYFKRRIVKFNKSFAPNTISVIFKVPNKVEEIRWSEYMKTCNAIFNKLNREGFGPITYSIFESKGWVSLTFLVTFTNSQIKVKAGPPAENVKASLEFIKTNDNIFVGNDMKIYSVIQRKTKNVQLAVRNALKRPVEIGIAKGLLDSVRVAKVVTFSSELKDKEYFSAVNGSLNEIFYAV